MTKVDENIQTAQDMLSGIVERCYELEEENKTLKEYNRRLKQGNDDLKEQNKKLKEEVEQLKNQRIFNSAEYDLITLTSTTPQWELRRK